MEERLLCKQEAKGSSPFVSTSCRMAEYKRHIDSVVSSYGAPKRSHIPSWAGKSVCMMCATGSVSGGFGIEGTACRPDLAS